MHKFRSKNVLLQCNVNGIIRKLSRRHKTDAIAAAYQPKNVEADSDVSSGNSVCPIYSNGQIDAGNRRYSSILPPPNVTGHLHLGHALMATVQDVIVRWKQSNGFDVVWVPGTDHAGIATQVMVEKKLKKERGLSRHDIGKEAFLKEVWKWKNEHGSKIKYDLQSLGTSFNWDKEYFTMDEKQTTAVRNAFIRLFEDGLIYRESAPVNWSCTLESAISDIEVESIDIDGPTDFSVPGYDKRIKFGQITDIAYKRCDNNGEIIVSTTRPESLLGDTAVAVHPHDERYASLKESNIRLWHPFRHEEIPLIFDKDVDPAVGTGAVKITPAHSKIDHAIAKRHGLQMLTVINEKGLISTDCGRFGGMQRFSARDEIMHDLANLGLLRETKAHKMQLPICSRSKDVIEHLLKSQWFIRFDDMARAAIEAVENGELTIHPPNFEKEWRRWLSNSQDWCISRQLWWGHQIPAYECEYRGDKSWIAAHNVEDARKKATIKFNAAESQAIIIKQDEDVLDTWFSSALLPFSLFGWPQADTDFTKYYPLDMLETGHDILFFWVARMVVLGQRLTGQLPFKNILLHGIICDEQGRKMSKSVGNVILPEQIINGASLDDLQNELTRSFKSGVLNDKEYQRSTNNVKKSFPKGIPECGTDALRFTLCTNDIKAHFISFDTNECHKNRLFFNKVWQATKFTLSNCSNLGLNINELPPLQDDHMTEMDRWILSRLANTTVIFEDAMNNHNYKLATHALKTFLYSNLCDVYLETTKPNLFAAKEPFASNHCAILMQCLVTGIQHISHFTPFLAQELRKHLPAAKYFELQKWHNSDIENDVEVILEICSAIRQSKSVSNILRKHEPEIYLFCKENKWTENIRKHESNITKLTFSSNLQINQEPTDDKILAVESTVNHLCSFKIFTNSQVESKMSSINEKKLVKLENDLGKLLDRISSDKYRTTASDKVQRKNDEKIERLKAEIAAIRNII